MARECSTVCPERQRRSGAARAWPRRAAKPGRQAADGKPAPAQWAGAVSAWVATRPTGSESNQESPFLWKRFETETDSRPPQVESEGNTRPTAWQSNAHRSLRPGRNDVKSKYGRTRVLVVG